MGYTLVVLALGRLRQEVEEPKAGLLCTVRSRFKTNILPLCKSRKRAGTVNHNLKHSCPLEGLLGNSPPDEFFLHFRSSLRLWIFHPILSVDEGEVLRDTAGAELRDGGDSTLLE